jgi:hypothetical protein
VQLLHGTGEQAEQLLYSLPVGGARLAADDSTFVG